MDNNANYVNFIRKIYSMEKSESNHMALMEMFRVFEAAEKSGFNTDLSYDTLTAIAGFYPEVMDELAKYPQAKREKMFESAEALNYMAAGMFDKLHLYGKRAGNHAKVSAFSRDEWCDPELLTNWVWTDEYIIAGETILYMEASDHDGIITVPSLLAGRYISRLGQGSLRLCGPVKKVVIAPGISIVGAQPDLRYASALEFSQSVERVEIDQNILESTKVYMTLSGTALDETDRLKVCSGYRTSDGGFLIDCEIVNVKLPKIMLYKSRYITESYDLDIQLQRGSKMNILGRGQYMSLFSCGLGNVVSLYEAERMDPPEDIDRIGQLVRDNLCGSIRNVLAAEWYLTCRLYLILFDRSEDSVLQLFIGHRVHYDAEAATVRCGGKSYEIFRAYDNLKATGADSMALCLTDDKGCTVTDEEVMHYYLRRFRLIKMLSWDYSGH